MKNGKKLSKTFRLKLVNRLAWHQDKSETYNFGIWGALEDKILDGRIKVNREINTEIKDKRGIQKMRDSAWEEIWRASISHVKFEKWK
jgi:hypothetical protein